MLDIFCYVRTTFSNGRIHFRNAWRYVLGEVVQEKPADVEERLWHVGTEGLILERRERDYYWDMSVEFDDLIDNYFVDEVPSWLEWREGWRDFVSEFGRLMDYYFEEDWDEEWPGGIGYE